jgi:hypothetical protein
VFGFDFDTRNGWALADYTNNRILAFSRCDSISTPTATMTPVVVPCGNRAQDGLFKKGLLVWHRMVRIYSRFQMKIQEYSNIHFRVLV